MDCSNLRSTHTQAKLAMIFQKCQEINQNEDLLVFGLCLTLFYAVGEKLKLTLGLNADFHLNLPFVNVWLCVQSAERVFLLVGVCMKMGSERRPRRAQL